MTALTDRPAATGERERERQDRAEQKLRAIEAASGYEFPTAPITVMVEEIVEGYDVR